MTYQIATGHDNAAGLADVTPQPASPGILYPRRVYAASGDVYEDGTPYTLWGYKDILPADEYAALLTAFGLASAVSALVTVRTVAGEDRTTFANYNARVIKPRNGDTAKFANGFWHDVVFVIRELEAL